MCVQNSNHENYSGNSSYNMRFKERKSQVGVSHTLFYFGPEEGYSGRKAQTRFQFFANDLLLSLSFIR